jgi:hypothetical protein
VGAHPAADRLGDPLGDHLRRAQRFTVPDAHHLITLARQPRVTPGVATLRLIAVVPRAVDLDDQARAMMGEVRDVSADGGLPTNVKIQLAELSPQSLLRERHFAAKSLRPGDRAGRMPIMLEACRRDGRRSRGADAEIALPAGPSFHPIPALPH